MPRIHVVLIVLTGVLVTLFGLSGVPPHSIPPRAVALSPSRSIPFSFTGSDDGSPGLCEDSPHIVTTEALQAGDVVKVQATVSGGGDYGPYGDVLGPPNVGLTPSNSSGEATYIQPFDEDEVVFLVCVSFPDTTISGTFTINPGNHLVTLVELGQGTTPVIRDCDLKQAESPACDGPSDTIEDYSGEGCDSSYPSAQWRDCEDDPDGVANKNWPVMAVVTDPISIREVRFKLPPAWPSIDSVQLVANITLGNQVVAEAIDHADAEIDGDTIVARDLSAGIDFPDEVKLFDLGIEWLLEVRFAGEDSYSEFAAGRSQQPIYVMLAKPRPPTGYSDGSAPPSRVPEDVDEPFLSLVALSVEGAHGIADEDSLRDHIWSKFQSLSIHRYHLDPSNGAVTQGGELRYYPDWSVNSFFSPGFPADRGSACATILQMLNTHEGRCNSFAATFAAMLGLHGIKSEIVALKSVREWQDFERLTFPRSATFMLAGRSSWQFGGTPTGSMQRIFYTIARILGYSHTMRYPSGSGLFLPLSYVPSPSRIAQGTNAPPGIYEMGDHAIARSADRWYDPSYGTSFDSVVAWARESIAGSASLFPFPQGTARNGPAYWRCTNPRQCVLWARPYIP